MASKSILKNITIKEKSTSYSLINALENAGEKVSKKVEFSRRVKVADGEMIQKLFGEKNK